MKKRGIGMASMWYGIGNTGLPNPAGAYVDLLDDGTVLVLTGCADIGQGSTTALAQIAAEELGVKIGDVRVVSAVSDRQDIFRIDRLAAHQRFESVPFSEPAVRDLRHVFRRTEYENIGGLKRFELRKIFLIPDTVDEL